MTIGISKERLVQLMDSHMLKSDDVRTLMRALIRECKELNPWLPIDENTPKDRRVLLLYPNFSAICGQYDITSETWWPDLKLHNDLQPTHWQELPDDSK